MSLCYRLIKELFQNARDQKGQSVSIYLTFSLGVITCNCSSNDKVNIIIIINFVQVVFIDEIDSICRKRSIREEEYTRRIKTELLKQVCRICQGHFNNL